MIFDDIEAHLARHKVRMAGRQRFIIATDRMRYERELWRAIAPFLATRAEHLIAARFMADILRERLDAD